MKGRDLRIVAIGKLHGQCWREACDHYLKLISRWQHVEIVELRDSDPALPRSLRVEQEGERLLRQIDARDYLVSLGEGGEAYGSEAFSRWLENMELEARNPVFAIGGPFGLAGEVISRSQKVLSLSHMTWPHELCRVLLLEQIFRANCIRRNFPYHH